ncbi:hypothetical protein LTR84_010528 [Exophiala bonariae]|uniref:Quinate repressor protein n=1 Tax=Exophiala bonariae TaxID=1690606 RepID=A0AAV9MT27_9EURO|nr:hypothetical protein LTR84_010528 [Exophiala bonariae]
MYRSCSNFEFYNIDEAEFLSSSVSVTNGIDALSFSLKTYQPQSLLLKRTEESFVRLVRNVWRGMPSPDQEQGRLNFMSTRAIYTYLLSVSLDQITDKDFRGEWLDCGADACQLEIVLKARQTEISISLLIEEISRAFGILTRFFPGPIIYHVRLQPMLQYMDSNYFTLINHGLRLGTQYITMDLRWPSNRIETMFKSWTHTKFVGCYHDTERLPDGWSTDERWELYQKAQKLQMAGVRLTQVATSLDDNAAAVAFAIKAKRARLPAPFLINYNTGILGRPSLLNNHTLTPVTTKNIQQCSAGTEHRQSEQNVRYTIADLQCALYATFVYDPMRYYVVGLDVSYSLSPTIHNAAHKFFGMPHECSRLSTPTLEGVKGLFEDHNFGGMSIAQGFKRSIFPFLSTTSIHASNIGAVNTLIPIRHPFDFTEKPPAEFWAARNRAGPVMGLYGDNLDWVGMMKCVLRNLSPANVITSDSAALVIGAGGMARAAIYALLQLKVSNIVVFNRTRSNAEALIKDFSTVELVKDTVTYLHGLDNPSTSSNLSTKRQFSILESLNSDWPSNMSQPTIVICCVPAPTKILHLGANLTLPSQWMKSPTGGVVIDLNYQQLVTPLIHQIQKASDRGWVPIDGIQNLCAQSSAQFELLTSRRVPETLMRIAALEEYLVSHDCNPEATQFIQQQLTRLKT